MQLTLRLNKELEKLDSNLLTHQETYQHQLPMRFSTSLIWRKMEMKIEHKMREIIKLFKFPLDQMQLKLLGLFLQER